MNSLLRAFVVTLMVLPFAGWRQAQGPATASASGTAPANTEEQMGALQKNVEDLQAKLSATHAENPQDDKVKQQVEILQKQIETQQKMIQLLMDQVKKQP